MKKTVSTILIIFISKCLFGQIDIHNSNFIRDYDVSTIKKWIINFDSLGIRVDSTLTIFLFDTTGRLVEEKSRFNKDFSKYVLVKNFYNDKGYLIDSEISNPYLDGFYDHISNPDSSEMTEYELSRVKTITKRWRNGLIMVYNYHYGNLLKDENNEYYFFTENDYKLNGFEYAKNEIKCRFYSVKDKYGNKYCPQGANFTEYISIKTNGILTSIERYEYEFKK